MNGNDHVEIMSDDEIAFVSGGDLLGDICYVIGKAMARGAQMQQAVDAMDDPLLGAMSCGA